MTTETEKRDLKQSIGAFGLGVCLIIPGNLYRAWVLAIMWGWFVTPAWAIAAPPIVSLAGALMMLNIMKIKKNDDAPETASEMLKLFIGVRFVETIILGLAFILSFFMVTK